jgi:hypothetical protein
MLKSDDDGAGDFIAVGWFSAPVKSSPVLAARLPLPAELPVPGFRPINLHLIGPRRQKADDHITVIKTDDDIATKLFRSPNITCSNYSTSVLYGTGPELHACQTESFGQCCTLCVETPGCRAWDAHLGKTPKGANNCWLHANDAVNTPKPEHVSGRVPAPVTPHGLRPRPPFRMWASSYNITVDPSKVSTLVSTDYIYPPGTYNLVDKGCDNAFWPALRDRYDKLGVSCLQWASGWDSFYKGEGAEKLAHWGDDASIIEHIKDGLLSKNVSGAIAMDELGELPPVLPPPPAKPNGKFQQANKTGTQIMLLAAEGYRQAKRANPSLFLAAWNCGARSVFSELMLDGTIDLALIEGYTYCGVRVGKCASWAVSINDYYPRLQYAREQGWLNRSIFVFGYIVGRSELNPGAFTKESLQADMTSLKRDFPEMPGVGFYHARPGNLSDHSKSNIPDIHDNATFELIRFASKLAAALYPNSSALKADDDDGALLGDGAHRGDRVLQRPARGVAASNCCSLVRQGALRVVKVLSQGGRRTIKSDDAGAVAVLPGLTCTALGAAHAHTFVALAWTDTCECTDPNFPPQSNGSYQSCWLPKSACALHPVCNMTDKICKVFPNIAPMPKMLGVTGATPFGDTANTTAKLYVPVLEKMPVGHRALLLHDIDQGMNANSADYVLLPSEAADCADLPLQKYDGGDRPPPPLKVPAFATIWWDAAALQRRSQSEKWFPAFKKAGGQLDVLVMDSEERDWGWTVPQPPASNLPKLNRTAALRCMRARWNAVQADSRFSIDVLPLLIRTGFKPVGGTVDAGDALSSSTALADTLLPFSESAAAHANQTGDMNRVVWNAVMAQRMSKAYMVAFGDPARQSFPHLKVTNFGKHSWSPQYCPVDPEGQGFVACRAGSGYSELNTQSTDIYNEIEEWSPADHPVDPSVPGVDRALRQFAGVTYNVTRGGFNFMVLHNLKLRAMTLAFPEKDLLPWPSYKSFSSRMWDFLPETGPSDYYQEEILHAAVAGVNEFCYFNPWDGWIAGTRAMMADHQLLSDLLHELDAVIGCASREWVQDDNVLMQRKVTSFFLSGAVASSSNTSSAKKTTIWRFSPSIPILNSGGANIKGMAMQAGGDLSVAPLLFDGQSCRLVFKGGALLVAPQPSLASYGVWISQPSTDVKLDCGGKTIVWPPG